MEELNKVLIQALTPVFTALLLALLTILMQLTRRWIAYLNEKAQQAQLSKDAAEDAKRKAVLRGLIDLAGQKVLALEQTEVEFLKDKVARGEVSAENLPSLLSGVKQTAIDRVKKDAMSQGAWDEAKKIFKDSEADLTHWLADVIESQVCQLPPSGLQTNPPKLLASPAKSSAPSTSDSTAPSGSILVMAGSAPKRSRRAKTR